MKRILTRVLVNSVCWMAVAGIYGGRLAAQAFPQPADDGETSEELSLLAPPRATARSADETARAFLGVTFEPEFPNAAVAQSVAPASPAEQAGLRAGDVIETLNGQRVDTYQDVLDAVRWMKPGDAIDIGASRRVSIRTQAVLERAPDGYRRTVDLPMLPEYPPQNGVQPAAAEELLPAPAVSPNRTQQRSSLFNPNASPSRRYSASQEIRRQETDRASERNVRDRDSRNRGLFRRGRN